jgi:hypothetical protein
VYNGATLTMTITDLATAASYSTSWTINIPATIGSNTAYAGFTASTGGSVATQNILSWTFYSGIPTPVAAAATPTFSPAAGTYPSAQTVTISDATAGATIYYTTNGTTPTTASSVYSTPLSVGTTQTVNAIAVASGYSTSAIGSAAYTINLPAAATPTFSPAAGTYPSAQTVTISDATAGATIYYTTNGTTPTTASSVYSAPISVGTTQTVNAIAVASGYSTSAVGSAAYTIGTPPVVNYPTGFTSAAGFNLYKTTLVGGALQLTDGSPGAATIAWYMTPVNVQKFTTDFNFQNTSATADGFTFAIQNSANGVWAIGNNGGGLGYQGIGSSVAVKFDLYSNAGEGINSTGFYVNGAAPTMPSTDMTASGVSLHNGNVLRAHITYDGTTLTLTLTDTVTAASFTTSTAINIPTTVGGTTAYVGFTGGTGGASAIQKILNWTYTVN